MTLFKGAWGASLLPAVKKKKQLTSGENGKGFWLIRVRGIEDENAPLRMGERYMTKEEQEKKGQGDDNYRFGVRAGKGGGVELLGVRESTKS